uniref:Ring finger protein 17 n=1 Tax=Maylandia zebra TaxID=106582 RepID=A0A3P9CV28_9CICH|nr:RING finger protein 17 [Maylandia zebra]
MDRGENHSAAICKLCGEAFTLPEDDIPGNLPRVLLCGHIYCTFCLQSLECDSVIRCPECEVVSTLPEGQVYGLQEDSRIIGLIYTTKMNKMKRCDKSKNRKKNKASPSTDTHVSSDMEQPADIEKIQKTVDEALAQAAETLAQLVHIHETLTTGLEEQVKREVARLEMEIKQAADKALHAVQNWKDSQMSQLTELETKFSSSQAAVRHIQERIKALEIAMQMARKVRCVPFLEQYCILNKVLETLQAPVDDQLIDMKCITVGTGMSCVFQLECLNGNLALSLKMEVSDPKDLAQSPPKSYQPGRFGRKSHLKRPDGRNSRCIPRSDKIHTPPKQRQQSPRANSPSSRGSSPSPRSRCRFNLSRHSSASDLGSPDVIIEDFLDEGQALPPTGPELASDKLRINRRRKHQFSATKRSAVTQWVVVTHIVNPSQFYVQSVAERRESEILSDKINQLCSGDGCSFTAKDTVETESLICVKWNEGHWCRARVVEVLQKGSLEPVKTCAVTQLASIRVFFLDHGLTKSITINSEDEATEASLSAVNNQLRKVGRAVKNDLAHFAPMVIRCSLKDLVPYDVTKGWSKEAQVEFRNVVGSAAVEMRPLGQDRESLLVDLRKAPVEQFSSSVFISIREYLVFIEVARFYSPVTLSRKPLLYYPPVYPKINSEISAMVCHINNPANFYINLVDNMEFMLLSAKLQEFYNDLALLEEDKLSIYCPVIGQSCVARLDDKLWYRAQVTGHPGGRKVEVQFVDLGNRKILSVSDLRKIKDEFFALPARAINCCLSDVIPVDGESWTDACTNRFISLANQKLVTIIATGQGPKSEPLPVKLFQGEVNEPLTSIAELLVKEELACFKESLNPKNAWPSGDDSAIWDPPLEVGLATGLVDVPDQIISGNQKEDPIEPQLKLPAQLKDLKVRVCHVNSPSSFYVRFAQYDSQLKRICELVKQECARIEPQDVEWKADMYCAALFNGVWERAQICSDVTSSDSAEVRLCDHGKMMKIDVSNLRPLPSSLIGSLALECTLNDIRPTGGRSTWTNTACDSFSYYLTGASAVMTIKELTDERPVPVTLFCSNRMGEFISIADFLVSEGLALRQRKPSNINVQQPKDMDPPSTVREVQNKSETETSSPSVPVISFPFQSSTVSGHMPPKPAPRSIMTAEKVKTSLYQPPELPCLGHIQISISAVGEDGLIYVRTQNAGYQLEQLKERIQQSMKALPRQKPYTWKSVLGCAVIGPDMLWYRGQLLEVLGGHVKVQYVDYGLVENIPVVHVYPILLCDDVPQLCMICQLLGINPVGGKWQQDAVALMREVLLNRSVDMNVVELPADPRGPVTVELFIDGLSLSRILCQHEHASMDRTVSPDKHLTVMPTAPVFDVWDINTEGLRDPEELMLGSFTYPNLQQEGEHFKVVVKHMCTPNELFLWPLEGTADVKVNGESLDEALTRINRNIDTLPRLSNFPEGGPCLAEYSDGKYYRARLMKFISAEPVTLLVQHVDFGSDDTLPTSKLRQMPAELLEFPCRALKVKVAGFKAPSVTREENVLPYSPKWSMKAAMEMIDLLHKNITASVVAQEPELTVLLYSEDGELVHLPLVTKGLAELE